MKSDFANCFPDYNKYKCQ